MSPKMPAPAASQADEEMNMTRMLEGSAESLSDWQEDFLLAVHGAPSSEETVSQQEENATNENTQLIQEFQVPVCQEFLPDGMVTVAFNDAWSQQQVSAPSVELFQDYSCPPELQTAPSLYVVEGKEDPEDEGICIESPSPPTDESGLLLPPPSSSPVLSAVSQVTPPPPPSSISTITTLQPVQLFATNIKNSSPPASPEKHFFEQHNIMKWVIDDGDQSDIPELSHSPVSVSTPRPRPGISGSQTQSSNSRQVRVISSSATSSKSQDSVLISPKPEIMDNDFSVKTEDNDSDWTPSPSPSTQKRKRGRPLDVTPRKITAKLPRMRRKSTVNSDSDLSFPGLAYQSDSASGLTDEGVSALKYRRMRDLNNEASRRCRENRKTKQGDAEAELDALRQKNITLKQNVHHLESKVSRLKRKFLVSVKQPSREIALARQRQLGQSLAISPDMVGTFMTPDADIKPELDAFWSSSS